MLKTISMKIAPIKTAVVRLTSVRKMSSLQTNPYDTDQLPPSMEKKHEQDTIPLRREPLFSDDTRAKLKRLREHHFHPSNLPDSPEFGTNQYMDINEELKKQLKAIVSTFNAPIRYAVAYGDGLLKGKETKPHFIFGVSHPEHWHAINMQQNSHHYARSLRILGSGAVSLLQEKVGAGVYVNPYVNVNGTTITYGVISIDKMCKDLIDWDTLYVAGRMHRPVKILRDDGRVRLANQVNLTEAVRVALLTLPTHFTERELFERIASISSKDGAKSVESQMENFHRLYFGLLDDLPNVTVLNQQGRLQQSDNPRFRGLMVKKLPKSLYDKVVAQHLYNNKSNTDYGEDKSLLYEEIAQSKMLNTYIEKGLSDIISRTEMTQNVKSILTAGTVKSIKYAGERLSQWRTTPSK